MALFFVISFPEQLINRIRGLLVFIEKNVKSLKRRKYKGFCVFLLYGMVVVLPKYGENKVKRHQKAYFKEAESLAK